MASTRRLAAILAADVAGYSRLMGADEEGTHERLKAHLGQLVDPKIKEHRGRTGSLRSIAWPSFGRSRRRAAAEDAVSRGLVAHQLSGRTQVRTHSTIRIAYATHHCG